MPTLFIAPDPDVLDLYKERVNVHNQEGQENSGFDILCACNAIIEKGRTVAALVSSGICAEMVDDDGSSSAYMLVPRSSICNIPIRQHNGIGIIDAGYRGPIKIPITATANVEVSIPKGSRYFQLVHPSLKPFTVQIVRHEDLSVSRRQSGGFGSTGNEKPALLLNNQKQKD